MLTTSGTYPWSFVTQIFHNGQPNKMSSYYFTPFVLNKGNSKVVIRSRISQKGQTIQWSREKGQYDQQRSTKYCTENKRSSNTNRTKNRM